MLRGLLVTHLLVLLAITASAQPAGSATVLDVRKIWDAAPHNAFTDLVRWHDRWWCTFRESDAHVGADGAIRVITSTDAEHWESAALITEKDVDLRDPKLSITPEDRLMINAGGSIYLGTKTLKDMQPRVLFSADGKSWSAPAKVLASGDWLWRITWYQKTAYGAVYRSGSSNLKSEISDLKTFPLRLVSSSNGTEWKDVGPMEVSGQPNETTLRFLADGKLLAMVRRETGRKRGWLGVADAPYTRWTWHESNYQVGGPNFIELPGGRFVAAVRDYSQKGKYTTLIAGMSADATLTPLATLPSGGDTSYPGMVYHEGTLYVSYYSSHEGKTSIYLARVKLSL